jgi:hypothetical protein
MEAVMVRTSTRWLFTALLPVVLAGCGGAAPDETTPGQPDPSSLTSTDPGASVKPAAATVAIELARARTDAAPISGLAGLSELSAASDLSVEVATELGQLRSGKHTLVQKVSAPDGSPYQSCRFTFDRAAPASAAGSPQGACAVAAVAGESGALRLWNTLPLDGSVGAWTVQAFLDGAAVASAQATFTTRGSSATVRFALSRTDPAWSADYALASTARIEIAADLSGFAAGAHAARIDLLDADGLLFFAFHASFDPSSCELVQGSCRIWETLQITGTTIETYQRTGTWKARVVIDSAAAFLAEGSFVLR